MTNASQPSFILAIYPTSHGFAFVLFEGPKAPFDWGVKGIRGKRKNAKTVDEVKALLERYHPETLVIEHAERAKPAGPNASSASTGCSGIWPTSSRWRSGASPAPKSAPALPP